METLKVKHMELHNILQANLSLCRIEQTKILAIHILSKFSITVSDNILNHVMNRLRTSFINNYVTRWRECRNTLIEFLSKHNFWLQNFFYPFKNVPLVEHVSDPGKYKMYNVTSIKCTYLSKYLKLIFI